MARRTNLDKGKESLELLGLKIDPALKKAIEDEGRALGIPMSTYARQLLIVGWKSRHEAPIAKNPREIMLIDLFNELPLHEQEVVITMVEALRRKNTKDPQSIHPTSPVTKRNPRYEDKPIPTDKVPLAEIMAVQRKKGGGK